jgi:hypothetical protein
MGKPILVPYDFLIQICEEEVNKTEKTLKSRIQESRFKVG